MTTTSKALYLDTSILVAALVEDESHHEACLELLRRKSLTTWSHALSEVFATLTGGRLGLRVPPSIASELIEFSLLPHLKIIDLQAADIMTTIRSADAIGARGGAIYDLLHLTAARKADTIAIYTLNTRHFVALTQSGDPRIEVPA